MRFTEKGENEKECKGESAKQSKKAVSADLLIVRHPFCRPSNPIPRYFKIKILHVTSCSGSEVKNQSKSESGAQCAKKECLFPAPTPPLSPGSEIENLSTVDRIQSAPIPVRVTFSAVAAALQPVLRSTLSHFCRQIFVLSETWGR